MIRLKHILLEEKQIPNVLFISDNATDKRKGYARKLISSGVVTGEIHTADKQPADELVALVYYHMASGYYDAVVIECSGLFDDNAEDVISSLQNIDDICKRKEIQPIFIELPTDQFITSDEYTSIDRGEINNWISDQIHVNLSELQDDIYFVKGGMRLDKEGQNIIYTELKNIFSNFNDDSEIETATISQPKNLRKLQYKLARLGYLIKPEEINQNKIGDSTREAIGQFQSKNGLLPTGELDKKTIVKILSSNAITATADTDNKLTVSDKMKLRLGKSGQSTDATSVMKYFTNNGLSIAGAAGIAGYIKVESNFKTDISSDQNGLVGWSGTRVDTLLTWCESKNLDPLDDQSQLQFIWFELKTNFTSLLSYLKTTDDTKDATIQFNNDYNLSNSSIGSKIQYAEQYFEEYNSTESDSSLTGLLSTITLGGLASIAAITKFASIPSSSQQFFNQWKSIAEKHEKQFGIPVSITLAQAAIESAYGKSGLTRKYNNFFGITGAYNGKSVKMKNNKGQLFTWRVYPTPEDSFDDHASLLSRKYKPNVKNATYVDWAKSLTAGGYAESNYGNSLIKFIRQNGLDEYDSNKPNLGGVKSSLSSLFTGDAASVGTNYFGPGAGKLPGAMSGGIDGDWAGSLPKLISVLPAGTWIAGQKRSRKTTKGGSVSDHYFGNTNSYACDFMLDTAFNNDKTAATNFAIAIAQNAGKNITSWEPYVGSYLNVNTPDGYRVQIIWLSMVGGNHYDHVHVGVRKLNKK
jgi:flagellum-specific peptidoglycan hydrolase FlgJ